MWSICFTLSRRSAHRAKHSHLREFKGVCIGKASAKLFTISGHVEYIFTLFAKIKKIKSICQMSACQSMSVCQSICQYARSTCMQIPLACDLKQLLTYIFPSFNRERCYCESKCSSVYGCNQKYLAFVQRCSKAFDS